MKADYEVKIPSFYDEEELDFPGNYNLPEHLKNVRPGDLLVIAKYPKTHKYTREQRALDGFVLRADNYFYNTLHENKAFFVSIHDGIPNACKRMFRINGGKFDPNMFTNIEFYADMVVPYRGFYKARYGTIRLFFLVSVIW